MNKAFKTNPNIHIIASAILKEVSGMFHPVVTYKKFEFGSDNVNAKGD